MEKQKGVAVHALLLYTLHSAYLPMPTTLMASA